MPRIGKSTGTESRLVVARDKEEEGMGRVGRERGVGVADCGHPRDPWRGVGH